MIQIQPETPFQALWHPRLTPIEGWGALLHRIASVAFCIPNAIIALCVNPSRQTRFEHRDVTMRNHRYFNKEIVTPDGIHVVANVRLMTGATVNTPTVILLNPLGMTHEIHQVMVSSLLYTCNVVTFNYRGYWETRRTTDLVVDGESVYQYVTQELGTVAEHVHLFGYSLGGAVATQIRGLHPEGKLVVDRSFKSLFSLISEKMTLRGLERVVAAITRFVGNLIGSIVCVLGWELNGERVIPSLNPLRCRFTYLLNDGLIAHEASLASIAPEETRCLLRSWNFPPSHFNYINQYYEYPQLVDFLTNHTQTT